MAQCPNCSAAINDDFGLTECSNCKAQLLVHIDGRVEYSGAGSDEAVPSPSAAASEDNAPEYAEEIGADESFDDEDPPAMENAFDQPYEDVAYESNEERSDGSAAEPDDLFAEEDAHAEEFVGDPEEEAAVAEAEAEAEAEQVYPDFDEPEPPPPSLAVYVPPNDSPDLSDIAQFGNSDVSGGREGALRYNVRVSGIDTIDVRDAFREALTDRKFVWDTDQIVRSIRDGECVLKDVTATKAHVLISRLRTLPVEVEWEQYAIHQA